MEKLILITILTVFVISCKKKTISKVDVETTNIENLTPSPIVHSSLNKEQLDKIKDIQQTFREVYPVSLEKTINNFKRDQNPDNEINIWFNMANVFKSSTSDNLGDDKLELRKEAFKLILMRSMMPEKEAISSSDLKLLSKNEAQEILKDYTLDAEPIKAENR